MINPFKPTIIRSALDSVVIPSAPTCVTVVGEFRFW